MKKILIPLFLKVSLALALQGGPVQPDYMQFNPVEMPDMVNMQTGDFAYSLPLGEVPGPYGNYPLSISYQAGISPQQEATWVGLGWILNPGVINRDVRGVPDDQFHGGTLGFIYQYSSMSSWSVNTGWSIGVFSVGTTTTSHGGTGFSATVGPKLTGIAGVGFTVDSEAGVGVTVGIGNNAIGVNASLMISTKTGKPTVGLGVSAGVIVAVSAGVQYTPGEDVATSVGFSVRGSVETKGGPAGFSVASIGMHSKGGNTGVAVSVGGNPLSISNSSGKGTDKTSTTGFAIIIPTYVGVFSFGFSQSLYEYWLRQATSEYLYGYLYQAGPAVIADGENNIDGMPRADAGNSGSSSDIPWTWSMMGRSMESLGNEDLYPAYDVYSVMSEGVSGTFRPFTAEAHQIYKNISDKHTSKNKTVAEYSYLLDADAEKNQYENEFEYDFVLENLVPKLRNKNSEYPSYKYCITNDSCSPYALYKTRFLNEGNRLITRIDKDVPDTVRSRMNFMFMGEGNGYYESDAKGSGIGVAKKKVSEKLLKRTLNEYEYALYGSKKVEPLFKDNSPIGKLEGFKVTSSDGTQYFFKQPIHSYLNIDYSTNKEKGAPVFVDQKGNEDDGFWGNLVDGIVDWGKWGLSNVSFYQQMKNVYDIFFAKGTLTEKCDPNKEREDDLFFSYQINMNPHATQWLISEIRGPDFVELSEDINKNAGYQVKFNYTPPALYRWRTPFARPNSGMQNHPNFRQPRNGLTPENCDGRMYNASLGVKEYVYLKSIETATHKADFELNDPETNERVDGKGWELSDENGLPPIFVMTSIQFDVTTENWERDFVRLNNHSVPFRKQKTNLVPRYLYLNSELPPQLLESLENTTLSVAGFDHIDLDYMTVNYEGLHDSLIYELSGLTKTTTSGKTAQALHLKIQKRNGVLFEKTSGEESRLGLYKIYVTLADDQSIPFGYYARAEDDDLNTPPAPVTLLIGEYGTLPQHLMMNWGDLIWQTGITNVTEDVAENQMRYLEKISFYSKKELADAQSPKAYQEFDFDYDYSLQPKTLNSYCRGLYPEELTDITGSPDKAPLTVCQGQENKYLYGKLTLKSITEKGCRHGECASLPPFRFDYLSPSATAFRMSSKDMYIEMSQGFTGGEENNDPDAVDNFADSYYEGLSDIDVSIVSTSDAIDEYGFWNEWAVGENRKVSQPFADYGATAWSLNKVTDPAGGILEVEYERDRFQNGEDYSDEKRFVEFDDFEKCSKYRSEFGISSDNDNKLCLEIGQLYWREDCLGPRVAFWDKNRPTNTTLTGFEYLENLGNLSKDSILYYNLKSNIKTKVKCGLFGVGRCSRTRSVALFGDGRVMEDIKYNAGRTKGIIILDKGWVEVERGLQKAADKINADQSWNQGGTRNGFMWTKQEFNEIKGGDIRVSRLTRHDIDTKQQTMYDYALGEIAQLPDSAFNTVLGSRFYASKNSFALPSLTLKPKSRIVGFNDNDAFFVPGSRVTYPTITVRNVNSDSVTLNGHTTFKYITPESGVPAEFIDDLTANDLTPFFKLNLRLFKLASGFFEDGNRGRIVNIALLNEQDIPIGESRKRLIHEEKDNETWFYNAKIRDAKKIRVILMGDESSKTHTLDLDIEDPLTNFNEMTVSLIWGELGDLIKAELGKVWFRSQKEDHYPVLYKKVAYSSTNVKLDEIKYRIADIEIKTIPAMTDKVDEESEVVYHDLTGFLGLNYEMAFYRGNNSNAIPVKIDRSKFSTMAPDVLEDIATGVSSEAVRKKLGKQVEKWDYKRILNCKDNKEKRCKEAYIALFERDSIVKSLSHIRYPVFQTGSETWTGFDNQGSTEKPELQMKSSIENHAYDPLTGLPTVTLAKTPLQGNRESRKLTQVFPSYGFEGGNAEIANEMFRKNMFTQSYLTLLYSGVVDASKEWKSLLQKTQDSLRSASVSPYGFLDLELFRNLTSGVNFEKIRNRKIPIPYGTYTTKNDPFTYTMTELSKYQNISNQPSLEKYNGLHYGSIDAHMNIGEKQDVFQRYLSSVYSPDGMFTTGLFYPARLGEVALLTPYIDTVSSQNCTVSGIYQIEQNSLKSASIHCSVITSEPLIAEYRIKQNGKWETRQELLMAPSFALTLKTGDALNYLRIYPEKAEAKTFIYDVYGQLVQIVSEDNRSAYFDYNPLGQLAQIRDDDGVSYSTQSREFMNDNMFFPTTF
jgi:hypothetical protein